MSDIMLMCIMNLGLSLYVLYLRYVLKQYRMALMGAMQMTEDLGNGDAVVEKTADGFRVRRVKDDETSG